MGGATQVYIRAASLKWMILDEKTKRDIPKNLLKKMVKMKIKTENIKLTDYSPKQLKHFLPLGLVYLSHRYSLSLNTFQENIETVLEEIWKEEWDKQYSIQPESPYENFSRKSPSLFSTFQQPSARLVRRCCRAIIRENASKWFIWEIVHPETHSAVFPFQNLES